MADEARKIELNKLTTLNRTQLYLITPPLLDLASFPRILELTLDAGSVACVQLRLKNVPKANICKAIEILKPITQDRGITFLLNDDPALAADTGCDGVHIGQNDVSYAEARKSIGSDAIVGVTCHDSRHLAMEAAEQGADYVAFGAFFKTTTKIPKSHAKLEILKWWCQDTTVPAVAIGGINMNNCRTIIETGVDFLAISSGVWNYKAGPQVAIKNLNQLIDEASLPG